MVNFVTTKAHLFPIKVRYLIGYSKSFILWSFLPFYLFYAHETLKVSVLIISRVGLNLSMRLDGRKAVKLVWLIKYSELKAHFLPHLKRNNKGRKTNTCTSNFRCVNPTTANSVRFCYGKYKKFQLQVSF